MPAMMLCLIVAEEDLVQSQGVDPLDSPDVSSGQRVFATMSQHFKFKFFAKGYAVSFFRVPQTPMQAIHGDFL